MSVSLKTIQTALFFRHLVHVLPEEIDPQTVLVIGSASIFLSQITKRFPRAVLSQGGSVQSYLVIPREKMKFDFIIVSDDLNLDPVQLADLVSVDGYLFFTHDRTQKKILDKLDSELSCWNRSFYFGKIVSLYRLFGRGRVGDRLPAGYHDRQESKVNLSTILSGFPPKEFVGMSGPLGVRTKLGPFFVDEFTSDTEPDVSCSFRPRIIIWQPLTSSKKVGWIPFGFLTDSFQKGIGIITDKNKESYFQDWSKHARRHRERWLRDERYEMVLVSLDEYANAYHASKKLDWLTRTGFIRVLKYHVERHSEDVRLIAARDKQTRELVAGLAVIHCPDIQQSFHTTSFICDSVRQTSVGVGLIDYWYSLGIKEGIRFFNYGIVWQKGDPSAWKGYSKFKRQFNLYLIIYPKPLLKFVFSKKNPIT